MTKTFSILAVAGLAALALAVAGCGGGSAGYGSGGSTPKPAAAPKADGGASVGLAESGLGKILVDGQGRTLYLFEADKGSTSTCAGACASGWPPLTTQGKPVAGPGLSAAKLGTTKRTDGTTEVTYNGHPLYTFMGDAKPGVANGQMSDAFGAEWYVLSPTGDKIG